MASFFTVLFISSLIFLILLLKKLFWKEKIRRLDGKHVLITGGSSGIGKAVAIEATKLGADITIVARNISNLKKAVREITTYKISEMQKINFISLDTTKDFSLIEKNIRDLENNIGPIFMLVNTVGKAVCNKFEEAPDSDFRLMLDLNYLSAVYPTQIVAKLMKLRKEGYVVICGSQASLLGIFGMSAYCASKFALRGYAESLYMEMIPHNVSVTLCLPPDTNTPGYAEENLTKPEETKLISQSAGLFEPNEVAQQLLVDTLKKRFFSTVGLESFLLTTLCAGMSPFSSISELFLQISLMSFFRLIGSCYLLHFKRLILSCFSKNERENIRRH